MSLYQQLFDSLFSVLFPTPCSLCQQEVTDANGLGVCAACWQDVHPWNGPICPRCGLPLPSLEIPGPVESRCSRCRQAEYEFDLARSYGVYAGRLRQLILQLKFRRRARLGRKLGELLAPVLLKSKELRTAEKPIILPVPLHPSRQRERGFNQAELLAEGLSLGLGRERAGDGSQLVSRCLRRIRPTPPQTGLSLAARHENVRGVFAVSSPQVVQGRDIVLIDDVMTTGATLSACAAALKRAGAARIIALTLAHTSPQFPDLTPVGHGVTIDEQTPKWT